MKSILFFGFLIFSLGVNAQDRTPDIFIHSIFNHFSQDLILGQMRRFLKLHAGIDPLNHQLANVIKVDALIKPKMKPLVHDMISGLIQSDLSGTKVKIRIEGLGYTVQNAKIKLVKAEKPMDGKGIDLAFHIDFGEMKIEAKSLGLSFVSAPMKHSSDSLMDHLWIKTANPQIFSPDLSSLEMTVTINLFQDKDGKIKLSLKEESFSKFSELTLKDLKDDIVLSFGQVSLPDISIQIDQGKMPIQSDNIGKVLQKRKHILANIMLEPIIDELKKLPRLLQNKFLPGFSLPSAIPFTIGQDERLISLNQFFVTNLERLSLGLNYELNHIAPKSVSAEDSEKSKERLVQMVDSHEIDLVASVTDQVVALELSKILEQELVKENKDKKNLILTIPQSGIGFVHDPLHALGRWRLLVEAKLGGLYKVAIGKSQLKIPIELVPELLMKQGVDAVPELNFHLQHLGALKNDEQYRFKKLVMKQVAKALSKLKAKMKGKIPLPILKGIHLDFIRLELDPYHHFNVMASLDPDKSEHIKEFWNQLPRLLHQVAK